MEHADDIPPARRKELTQLALEHGLESAESIRDREIPLFNRGQWGFSNSGTFLRVPFLRDMRELGGQDVAFVGVPLDTGTTFRSGTRWGPEAKRRLSALSGGANLVLGGDLV